MYRNRGVQVTLLLLLVLGTLSAQRRTQPRGPRATALAVMSADGKSAVRLIPICIRDNDRFWDASIYQASPSPIALEPGIVYEVQRTGKPIGLFTISQPVQELGQWLALGDWRTPQPRAATAPTPAAGADDERPILRRGQPPAAPSQAAPAAPATPTPPPEDPDRPRLQRGKPAGSEPATPATPPGAASTTSASSTSPPKPPELLPAISDAGGPESHAFTVEQNADQEARLRKTALSLLQEAVLKHAGLSPTAARLDLKESSFRFFDLDGNNSAEVVLTARLALAPQVPAPATRRRQPPPRQPSPPPSIALREFYVTFVAREDLNTDLHPSFTRITDTRNLDLDGRLELIDAADVDGDGRGELLFRRLLGKDVTYIVLKIGLRQATTLFDSAGD